MAWLAPGVTATCWMGTQEEADVEVGLAWRQSSAVMLPLMSRLSVLWAGVVQWSSTWSPMRWAVRSVTISGRLSEGGRGLPGLAQPMARERSAVRPALRPLPCWLCRWFCGKFIGFQPSILGLSGCGRDGNAGDSLITG